MDFVWLAAGTLLLLLVFLLGGYGAHLALTRSVYVPSAKRYAKRMKLEPLRWNIQPALSAGGSKTEYSIVRLDCRDEAGRERSIDVLVWPFGVIRELPVALGQEGDH